MDRIQHLAAVMASHHKRTVSGRVRLQKTVMLLQSCGLPTDYGFRLHFRGPYSEELQADMALMEAYGLVEERSDQLGRSYEYELLDDSFAYDLGRLKPAVDSIEQSDVASLELAATYQAFRELGEEHEAALESMRRKKARSWSKERESRALDLLKVIGLRLGDLSPIASASGRLPEPSASSTQSLR